MLKVKFFADEDVDARLIKFLSDKGIDIIYTEKGVTNSHLYSLACRENRAILSRDKDFLNTALFSPIKLPLIIILRVHPPELSKLEPLVISFIEKLSDNMLNKTWELREDGSFIIG